MGDYGAVLSDWNDIIRRADVRRNVKTVAYYLAGRANNNGTRIYPGIWRTAAECKLSPAEVRRALKLLRDVELIELVRRGNRRRRKSDEYRLIIGPGVLEHVKIPTPVEHEAAIEALREHDRELSARRHDRWITKQHSELSTLTQTSVDSPDQRSESSDINAHPDERPPRISTSPESTTSHIDTSLRTDLEVVGAGKDEDQQLEIRPATDTATERERQAAALWEWERQQRTEAQP